MSLVRLNFCFSLLFPYNLITHIILQSNIFIMNSRNGRTSGKDHGIIDVEKRLEVPGYQCPICLSYTINFLMAAQHEIRCRHAKLISQLASGPRKDQNGALNKRRN